MLLLLISSIPLNLRNQAMDSLCKLRVNPTRSTQSSYCGTRCKLKVDPTRSTQSCYGGTRCKLRVWRQTDQFLCRQNYQ